MAKIPGTHKHAMIASIPHSKEYKTGWERTFGKGDKYEQSEPEEVAKSFLRYSFKDIGSNYAMLTRTEQELCTPEEFTALVKWMKS